MAHQDQWSDEELRASLRAYKEMQGLDKAGTPYIKKHYYNALSRQFGRTPKAFEYRMQNISAVLEYQGRSWLPGLVPARNVGTAVASRIENLQAELEGGHSTGSATFEIAVRLAAKKAPRSAQVPPGALHPKAQRTVAVSYVRDPAVKAWVLKKAGGRCESCGAHAPFETADGSPYLEIHHVRQLADGGSDTVHNAVALCPTCHRALHFAIDRDDRRSELFARVARLAQE